MNLSKGTLYFHRLFSVHELGFGNPEPFIGSLIRKFLRIGEAVAGRWIEMPQGILVLQLVPGKADSGAIYLYDRRQHVFYLLCFDGEDDHLTLEDFNHLLSEYDLLRYAEHPSLVQSRPPMPDSQISHNPKPAAQTKGFDLTVANCAGFTTKQGVVWYARPGVVQFHFQSLGSA